MGNKGKREKGPAFTLACIGLMIIATLVAFVGVAGADGLVNNNTADYWIKNSNLTVTEVDGQLLGKITGTTMPLDMADWHVQCSWANGTEIGNKYGTASANFAFKNIPISSDKENKIVLTISPTPESGIVDPIGGNDSVTLTYTHIVPPVERDISLNNADAVIEEENGDYCLRVSGKVLPSEVPCIVEVRINGTIVKNIPCGGNRSNEFSSIISGAISGPGDYNVSMVAYPDPETRILDSDMTNNACQKTVTIEEKEEPQVQKLLITSRNATVYYGCGKSKVLVDRYIIYGQLEPSGERVKKNAHIEVSVDGKTWVNAGNVPNADGGYQCTPYRLLKENAFKGYLSFRMVYTDGTISNILRVNTLSSSVITPPPVMGMDTEVSGVKTACKLRLVTGYISSVDKKTKLVTPLTKNVVVEVSNDGGKTFTKVTDKQALSYTLWGNGHKANFRFKCPLKGDVIVKVTTPGDSNPVNNMFKVKF
jgi:hypothetical protein